MRGDGDRGSVGLPEPFVTMELERFRACPAAQEAFLVVVVRTPSPRARHRSGERQIPPDLAEPIVEFPNGPTPRRLRTIADVLDEGAGGIARGYLLVGLDPGGPASGKFLARLPKSLHAALIERSKHEGVSMNQYLTALVAEGLGKRAPTAPGRDGRRSAPAARRRAPQHA